VKGRVGKMMAARRLCADFDSFGNARVIVRVGKMTAARHLCAELDRKGCFGNARVIVG
jgi:hypothetical protein